MKLFQQQYRQQQDRESYCWTLLGPWERQKYWRWTNVCRWSFIQHPRNQSLSCLLMIGGEIFLFTLPHYLYDHMTELLSRHKFTHKNWKTHSCSLCLRGHEMKIRDKKWNVIQWRIWLWCPSQMLLDDQICMEAHPGCVTLFVIGTFPCSVCALQSLSVRRNISCSSGNKSYSLKGLPILFFIICHFISLYDNVPVLIKTNVVNSVF